MMFAVSLVEYDGMIQVWREKARHDLVRPTTVIKHWDDDVLNTYGGDQYDGPVDIPARDFESILPPYEPSPEFPSINSCQCQGLLEFYDLYTVEMYGEKLQNFEHKNFFFEDMTQFRKNCAESQIYAGIHFPDSVKGGIELCPGLGTLSVEYLNDMKNGSDFNGGWYKGDT